VTQIQYLDGGNSEAQDKLAEAYLFAQSSEGIAAPGVLSGLAVAQQTTASGKVVVGAGACIVQASRLAGADRLINDTDFVLDVLGPNPVGALPRNDIVVYDAATLSGGTGGIRVILGAANAVPTDPTVPATAVPLARIRQIAQGQTGYGAITSGIIDDLRTYTQLLSGSPWRDYSPRLYGGMTGSPVVIGSTVSYARWRYVDPHTVQAVVSISRQSGTTITDGLGVDLPVPGAFRSLNCGSLNVHGSSVPTGQSGVAYMSPDRTKLIPVAYTNAYLSVNPSQEIRFNVTYEV
jgi:hypothetical protein